MGEQPENQAVQTPSTNGMWKTIFYHPNFNVVAGIFGIVGTFLAIYFYLEGVREPDLTYYVSPTRTPIVQKGNLNNFSVTFKGVEIDSDISTAEIQIWNRGKSPIHREDILKTVTIRTPNGERIYQTAVATTRDVVGFNWINTTNNQGTELSFDWKILEQNDGIKLQIIYGGKTTSAIKVDSIITGQEKIDEFNPNSTMSQLLMTVRLISLLVCFFVFVITLGLVGRKFKQKAKYPKMVDALFVATLGLAFLIFCIILLYTLRSPAGYLTKPPFGF